MESLSSWEGWCGWSEELRWSFLGGKQAWPGGALWSLCEQWCLHSKCSGK